MNNIDYSILIMSKKILYKLYVREYNYDEFTRSTSYRQWKGIFPSSSITKMCERIGI